MIYRAALGRSAARARTLLAVAALGLLAACGGNDSGAITYDNGGGTAMPPKSVAGNAAESSRFLAQATYGGTDAEIDRLQRTAYVEWLQDQFAKPATVMQQVLAARASADPEFKTSTGHVVDTYWQLAAIADDQLRQRVTFALSQIFVVSVADDSVSGYPLGIASYYDMLSRNAFGNFRTLLEDVATHPMMGLYLTHLRNQKEDTEKGRVPDENFARELMQLFTIGLYELELDGTVRRDSRNAPLETYDNDDVSGLAKVFTGWSWGGPDASDARFYGSTKATGRESIPMRPYPKFHATTEKRFLGTTIPAQNPADPAASLRIALDRLFSHPNVGPFISRQLIQRLVTSNPSPGYVARVAAQFNDNGEGQRGDLRAVIRAILFDVEARDDTAAAAPGYGRLREPVLRLANWIRVFQARSTSQQWSIGSTDNPGTSLGQSPLRAPSVFNFYRPGYVPPNTPIAAAGLVSPEMQITHETSVAGYLNAMRTIVERGIGSGNPRDVMPRYDAELRLADTPGPLVDRMNRLLLNGNMSPLLRTQLIDAVGSIGIPTGDAAGADRARRNRVWLAVYLAMASPEYLVQR